MISQSSISNITAKWAAALLFVFYLSSCSRTYQIENGDLLFQTAVNQGMEQAIEASTSRNTKLNYVHVGIAMSTPQGIKVIEAVPPQVRIVPLKTFLGEGRNKPITDIYRIQCGDTIKNNAIKKALSLVGCPYDNLFQTNDSAFYCSELVLECFVDAHQQALFNTLTMTFKNSEGTFPEFWIEHFKALNAPIPEGAQGSNPNDLSKNPRLKHIGCLR